MRCLYRHCFPAFKIEMLLYRQVFLQSFPHTHYTFRPSLKMIITGTNKKKNYYKFTITWCIMHHLSVIMLIQIYHMRYCGLQLAGLEF